MRAGFLAEECIVGKSLGEPLADEELGIDIGLAHDVLRALASHLERFNIGEVGGREGTGLGNKFGCEGKTLVDLSLRERASGHRCHAANVASRLLTTFDGTVVGSHLRADSVLVMWAGNGAIGQRLRTRVTVEYDNGDSRGTRFNICVRPTWSG